MEQQKTKEIAIERLSKIITELDEFDKYYQKITFLRKKAENLLQKCKKVA